MWYGNYLILRVSSNGDGVGEGVSEVTGTGMCTGMVGILRAGTLWKSFSQSVVKSGDLLWRGRLF